VAARPGGAWMFYYDHGLFLTRGRLAIDVRRRQARGFISHAHTDHMAPHEVAYCTPGTARLYAHRHGDHRRTVEMPYRRRLEFEGQQLSAWPAGHVLGSAMLLVEDDRGSLLYTGDFKLGPSATAEPAELPRADLLVIESTYGQPRYRLPPRQEIVARLLGLVGDVLDAGRTPVLHAYVLGKAQEVTRLLTDAGIRVLQHPLVYAVSRVYEAAGCPLGDVAEYPGFPSAGCAVVVPPRGQRAVRLEGLEQGVAIAVTGWAIDSGARYRLGVDHALPLSDHADYDELIEAVRQVAPRRVYCTHGPESFVARLVEQGFDAQPLSGVGPRGL